VSIEAALCDDHGLHTAASLPHNHTANLMLAIATVGRATAGWAAIASRGRGQK
jgi:hypothetical protein